MAYKPLSAKASMLSAHVVPDGGGETEWADMRAAHDALDRDTRERIAGLSAHHSLAYSQARAGFNDRSFDHGFSEERPPLRPLVKEHPVTGRPAMFIGRHAHAVPGLAPEESAALLDQLLDHACRGPRTLRDPWRPGDLVVGDTAACSTGSYRGTSGSPGRWCTRGSPATRPPSSPSTAIGSG